MAVSFKGAHFPQEIILTGVRWYVAYPLSTRHVEELMLERGVHVDHSTINRWVIEYSPQLEQESRLLKGQPALGLEVRTLRTRPVPTGVVPNAGHRAVGTGVDMAPEGRGPAQHDGTCRAADVGGQGLGAFVLRIARTEDDLQG